MPAEPNVSRTEQTRERIVATAFLLVRRVGLRHLAMDAVAADSLAPVEVLPCLAIRT